MTEAPGIIFNPDGSALVAVRIDADDLLVFKAWAENSGLSLQEVITQNVNEGLRSMLGV